MARGQVQGGRLATGVGFPHRRRGDIIG